MSAKIAAVNQTRSESEIPDRAVTVSVIDVEPSEVVPPPPSYEQAIITQSDIERRRIQNQQRALEALVREQNRLERNRRVDQQPVEQQPVEQQPAEQQPAEQQPADQQPIEQQPQSSPAASTPTTPSNYQIIQHVYAAPPLVGPIPANLTCPSCQEAIKTRIEYAVSARTHIGALLCCIVCWPCAFCPYILKGCRDALHYCPNCGEYIGIHTPYRA